MVRTVIALAAPEDCASRATAAAFSVIYGSQFESGPLSEASFGNVAEGILDHRRLA